MKITFRRGSQPDVILAHVPSIGLHIAFDRKQARKFVRGSGIRLPGPSAKIDQVVTGELTVSKPSN
jgi:hypothetical protein